MWPCPSRRTAGSAVSSAPPSRSRGSTSARDLYWRIALAALIVAVLAALIGLFVSRRISGQMREIKEAPSASPAATSRTSCTCRSTLEFAAVAESLNAMAEELDEKIGTLTRERNEREAVLASMVEGVLAVDADERIIALNEAAAGLPTSTPRRPRAAVQEVLRNPDLQRVVAQTLRAHARGGRHRHARRRRGPLAAGQRHAAARRRRRGREPAPSSCSTTSRASSDSRRCGATSSPTSRTSSRRR